MQENKSSVPQINNYPNQFTAPPKSMRISDLYFPDPMFYPGYYPSGMNPYGGGYNPYPSNIPVPNIPNMYTNPNYNQVNSIPPLYDMQPRQRKYNMSGNDDNYERIKVNSMNNMNNIKETNRSVGSIGKRYSALQDFVSTVHRVHNNGSGSRKSMYNV